MGDVQKLVILLRLASDFEGGLQSGAAPLSPERCEAAGRNRRLLLPLLARRGFPRPLGKWLEADSVRTSSRTVRVPPAQPVPAQPYSGQPEPSPCPRCAPSGPQPRRCRALAKAAQAAHSPAWCNRFYVVASHAGEAVRGLSRCNQQICSHSFELYTIVEPLVPLESIVNPAGWQRRKSGLAEGRAWNGPETAVLARLAGVKADVSFELAENDYTIGSSPMGDA